MTFNSLQFAGFFVAVYFLYLQLNHSWQNRLLLAASCLFYAAWDWRFLAFIFISVTTDYFCALKIQSSKKDRARKYFLVLSLAVNLSILGFFKYFHFFSSQLTGLFGHFGFAPHPAALAAVLPLGISFYTFRTLSYTIDVYTGKMEPTRNYFDYAASILFFPLLLAGPIMKAADFLPQIQSPRKIRREGFYEGCYLIYWGLFQKVTSDYLRKVGWTVIVDLWPESSSVVFFAYTFAFQLYCDFAGYSNMAKGLGKCMGFDIMTNFDLPYLSTNPQEFWGRWHISLTYWLRDYVYTPLAFRWRNFGRAGVCLAILATFILCGIWHGAAWNFVIWGAYWGLLMIVYLWVKPWLAKIPEPKTAVWKQAWFAVRVLFFFHFVCLGWMIFLAPSLEVLSDMVVSLLNFFHDPFNQSKLLVMPMGFLISTLALLFVIDGLQYKKHDLLAVLKLPVWTKGILYFAMYYLLVSYGVEGGQEFIYFKF